MSIMPDGENLATHLGQLKAGGQLLHRQTRDSALGSFDPRIRLDGIGIPRGVPDECKECYTIWAGLESTIPCDPLGPCVGVVISIAKKKKTTGSITSFTISSVL